MPDPANCRRPRTLPSPAGVRAAACAGALLTLAGCGSSPAAPNPTPTPTPQSLAEALAAARVETGVPGASAAIVRDGTVVFEGASGEASRSPARPLRPTHLLPLVGVTHLATATMALRLEEEGRLRLDDPLARYAAYMPGADRISLRMLLGHRSGLPDYLYQGARFPELLPSFQDPNHRWTREEVLRAIEPDDVDRTPGAYFFSGTDYVALGAALEQASGTSLGALFDQLVAAPLGLRRCVFDMDPALAPDVAQGFAYDGTSRAYTSIFPPSGAVPTSLWGPVWTDNGLMCSPLDAARLTDALLRGTLVSPESRAAMTEFGPEGYGLGVARKVEGSRTVQGHAGARAGYGAVAWYDPARLLTIVALTNADAPGFPASTVHDRLDQAYSSGLR